MVPHFPIRIGYINYRLLAGGGLAPLRIRRRTWACLGADYLLSPARARHRPKRTPSTRLLCGVTTPRDRHWSSLGMTQQNDRVECTDVCERTQTILVAQENSVLCQLVRVGDLDQPGSMGRTIVLRPHQ